MFYSILNNPNIFNAFSKYLGDQRIVSEAIKEQLTLKGDERILDLGCGTGSLSRMLLSENYIGVDSDEKYIKFARENYKREFIVMNAAELKFADNSFDIIFSKDLFHHLEDEIFMKVISEIKRVLKTGGRTLIVEISYRLSKDMLYKKILRGLDRGEYIREFSILKETISSQFNIDKGYIQKGVWGDLAVFLATK